MNRKLELCKDFTLLLWYGIIDDHVMPHKIDKSQFIGSKWRTSQNLIYSMHKKCKAGYGDSTSVAKESNGLQH